MMRGFNFLKGHWEAVECVQRLKNDRVSVSRGTGSGDEGKRNFRGPKGQLFLQNEGLFKAST